MLRTMTNRMCQWCYVSSNFNQLQSKHIGESHFFSGNFRLHHMLDNVINRAYGPGNLAILVFLAPTKMLLQLLLQPLRSLSQLSQLLLLLLLSNKLFENSSTRSQSLTGATNDVRNLLLVHMIFFLLRGKKCIQSINDIVSRRNHVNANN